MALAEKLDVWKKDLIDMSRRNALLYYKADGPRPSGLSLQNADATLLYEKLVLQRSTLSESMLGLPDAEDDPAPLKRLERLRVQARDDARERGVQSLYMAFGMLEWYEAIASENPAYSPILLVPVAINRSAGRSMYALSSVEDEDIEINPTLHEWLLSGFHVTLPTYQQCIEQAISATATVASAADEQPKRASRSASRPLAPRLNDVLSDVEASLGTLPSAEQRRWRVRRDVCLARFSFQKLVMRQDLERHEGEALAHPALRRLGGDQGSLKDPAGLISIDQLDSAVHPADMLEILDADSSQQEAIQAAKAGQSFVLQGPPGTGKSQTIANIIAECLGQSKTVLFVSEKMAALDVVRKRLQAAGLGEFLLDLHDAKQNKRAFVSELDEAVKQARQAASSFSVTEWKRDSELLEQERNRLNEYVRQLHARRFALEISAYDAYGRLAMLAAAPASDAGLSDDIKRISPAQLERMRESLRQLLDYEDVLDAYWSHPWRETSLTSLTSEQASAIEHHFDLLAAALSHAQDDLAHVAAALGQPDASITFGWAEAACERLRVGLESPLPPAHWFRPDVVERLRPTLTAARSAAAAYHGAHLALDETYDEDVYQLSHQRLLDALTKDSEDAIAVIRPAGERSPHDVAISDQQELDERLAASASLLRDLAASASRVAETLGFSAPSTFDQIEALVRQAENISTSPMPPRAWLDPDTYAEARIVTLNASDKALWARQARSELSARYLPAYLETDLRAIDGRFREQYDSFVRYILPQYYLDLHALRRLLQPGAHRTSDDLRADTATAVKLRETEGWLQEHRAEHARLLGRHYNGEQTDWAQVRAMVEWADTFHSLFSEDAVSEDVSRLVTGPANIRAQLEAALEPLTEQWRAWQADALWLARTVDARQLLKRDSQSGVTDTSAYATALEHLLQPLKRYWQAASEVSAVRRDPSMPSWRDLVSDLRRAREAHDFDIWLTANRAQLENDLGSDFVGVATNWEQACVALAWATDFMRPYPESVPEPLIRWVARGPDIQQQRQRIKDVRTRALERLSEVEEELEYLDRGVIARTQLCARHVTHDNTEIVSMRQRVDFLRERLPSLARWVACGQRIMDCRALGLGALIDAQLKGNVFPRDIIDVFERRFFSLWLDAALAEAPVLKRFAGETQDRLIQRFRQLDLEHMALAQRQLVMLLRQRRHEAQTLANAAAQSDNPDVVAFGRSYNRLVREAQKKRSPAIRQIVRNVFEALIQVKPCWMMSPLTVSQFIETANPVFDLVIFDEASQVLTEDAICAIMRGRQLIVVGDEKQLPPTSFFAKSIADDDDDDDDDEQSESAESERTESILKEMLSANITARSLRWHYRSQHESLIAFSNSEFYGGQLITFPGTDKEHSDGVRFEFVADGVYDYGGTRTNRREAERVVDVLIRLVHRRPDSSLGVVALSGAQQSAIREALANRFKTHPELAAIKSNLDEDSADDSAFFVKNLESVQGDERDIIVLSIGYGPDKRAVVHHNFGPVNRKGGERRLNVAVTRARQQMVVVSSIKASDINPTGNVSVQVLRRYLAFAEQGVSALKSDPTSVSDTLDAPRFESPFEQAVYDALMARGLQLITQVGCSGYRIDLAARDPEQPDRYVLGIECDGRSYHSSKTARDRDRLRQAHLESLGWTIHRIWSSDWFANREREIEKTLRAFEEARGKRAAGASERVS